MRLDAALAARGLARSRTHAQQLIADGLVWVDGVNLRKAATAVDDRSALRVDEHDHYVSRAAHKLLHALECWPVAVTGRLALDAGASTGGFTQVLLERDARRVIALDVGHGQLAPSIRADERVCVVEGENVRELSAARLAELTRSDELPSLVVADLSFISLGLVLDALIASSAADADYLLLIKPQFEVGRSGVREGIVRDPVARTDAVNRVLWAAHDCGLRTAGLERSPLAGEHGNVELLVWFSHTQGSTPAEWRERCEEVAR